MKPQRYLKIRTWKDMAKEYGTNIHGDITVQGVFLKDMKPLANTKIPIPDITTFLQYWDMYKVVTIAEMDNDKYYITLPMLTKKSQGIVMTTLMKYKIL